MLNCFILNHRLSFSLAAIRVIPNLKRFVNFNKRLEESGNLVEYAENFFDNFSVSRITTLCLWVSLVKFLAFKRPFEKKFFCNHYVTQVGDDF